MYIKLLGAVLILTGCGGCGLHIALSHRREVRALHQLVQVLDGMICELEYRLPSLPELCRLGAEYASGAVNRFFLALSESLMQQMSPDVEQCILICLEQMKELPPRTAMELAVLGRSLGKFDLEGQINTLKHCKTACLNSLEKLEFQQDKRLRSYQTLGFCAGAALAILLF